jgi:hypothetical protein
LSAADVICFYITLPSLKITGADQKTAPALFKTIESRPTAGLILTTIDLSFYFLSTFLSSFPTLVSGISVSISISLGTS